MTDIVERLRKWPENNAWNGERICVEAAAEIERLRVQRDLANKSRIHWRNTAEKQEKEIEQLRKEVTERASSEIAYADEAKEMQTEIERLNALILAVSNNIASSPAKVLEESVLVGKALDRPDCQDREIERLRSEEAHTRVLLQGEKAQAKADKAELRAEIERLREQLLVCENKRLGGEQTEIERLRLENDGLKLAVKMRPLPEYRDDPRLQEIIAEQKAEIERLREELNNCTTVRQSLYEGLASVNKVVADRNDEIKRLREEIKALQNTNSSAFSDAEFQRQCDVMREVLAGYCELKRIREAQDDE